MMSYGGPPPMPGGFGEPGGPNDAAARQMVQAPALAIIITNAIWLVFVVIGMFAGGATQQAIYRQIQDMQAKQGQPVTPMPPQAPGPLDYAGSVLALALGGMGIFGGMKMRNLEGYGLSMAGVILQGIPCLSPCCCTGLPLGIWALVVLSKPEVKGAFRS